MQVKVKYLIYVVLVVAGLACVPALHSYAEAHRTISGIGGELFFPALILAAAVMIDQFRQLWTACSDNDDDK